MKEENQKSWSQHPSAPPPGTRLCLLEQLPAQGGVEFILGDPSAPFRMFVIHHEGGLYAYLNSCAHFVGTPLNPNGVGNFIDHENPLMIRCRVHGAMYHLTDGACARGDCDGHGLEAIPVHLIHGDVVIGESGFK